MKAFTFVRARTCGEAAQLLDSKDGAMIHAGGTDLLARLKERTEAPDTLVSLCDAQGLEKIVVSEEDGSIWIGARVTLAQLARWNEIQAFLPTLAHAAGLAASPQLRSRATIGGNLAQHTRCHYYRMESLPCLKRSGTLCPVQEIGGVQDNAGVFEGSCVCSHPSSLAPVLGTLAAEVHVRDAKGPRMVPFAEFWASPQPGVGTDTVLKDGEVIEAIRIPPSTKKASHGYYEVRHKSAFDWALVSCAVRYVEGPDGKITDASIWYGSIAPTPWRAAKAEAALIGKRCTDDVAMAAAEAGLTEAKPVAGAAYKVKLAKVALKRALADARGRS